MSLSNNKYGSKKKNNKPEMDGYKFDSRGELKRYFELKLLQKIGEIKNLVVHPKFLLRDNQKNSHGQNIPKWEYTADFGYFDLVLNCDSVEDVKSLRIDRHGKKHGTATLRDYKLSRNEFMRQNPDTKFIETCY